MGFFGSNPNKGYSAYGDVTSTSGGGNHNAGLPTGYRATNIHQTASGRYGFQDSSGDLWYGDSADGKFYRHTSHGRDWVQLKVTDPNAKPEDKPAEGGGGGSGGGSSGGGSSGGGGGYGGGGYGSYSGPDPNTLALMEMVKSLTESLTNKMDMQAEMDKVSKPGNGLESTVLNPSAYVGGGKEKKKKSYLTPVAVSD